MEKLSNNLNYKDYPILIVDDDKIFLELFSKEFSEFFKVYTADSAKKGMKIVNEKKDIAVVLADQRMPEVTGVEMLAQLKTQYPFITRILITGYADIEAAIDAINIGDIFKYISKPYKFEEVTQIIQRGIKQYYFTKENIRLRKEEIERLRRNITEENISTLNSLTYGLSHHFQNKLSAALAFFDLLPDKLKELIKNIKSGVDKDYWHNYAKVAERGVKNVTEIINDLFTYSNMADCSYSKVDMVNLIKSERQIFKNLAKQKEIDFQYDLPDKLPLVEIDQVKISQALENIVLNAIQAVPKKGTIKISSKQKDDNIVICIEDNGIGITEESIKKIFYPFFTTKGPQVKGLGLTVADAFIRLHSGKIEVQSKPKQGTRVIINLSLKITIPTT